MNEDDFNMLEIGSNFVWTNVVRFSSIFAITNTSVFMFNFFYNINTLNTLYSESSATMASYINYNITLCVCSEFGDAITHLFVTSE